MRLIELTEATSGQSIFLNPDMVVAVYSVGPSGANVYTTARDRYGHGHVIEVTETAAAVAGKITGN